MEVDILAGADSVNADESVPVVRSADHHRIDILVGQQFVVVCVAGHSVVGRTCLFCVEVVDELLAVFYAVRIQIAHRHDFCAVIRQQHRHIVTARDAPCADAADVDALAGRILPEH